MTASAETASGPPRDPGLQPERTRLAWSRTSMAFFANGALMLHAGHQLDHWAWTIPGVLILVVGAGVYATGILRHRRVEAALAAGAPVAGTVPIQVTAAASIVVGIAGIVIMLFHP